MIDGTGSPRFPGQNPEIRKTVVVVVVVKYSKQLSAS